MKQWMFFALTENKFLDRKVLTTVGENLKSHLRPFATDSGLGSIT